MGIIEGCSGPHRTPIPEDRVCPVCGEEVEVFTVRGRIAEDSVCACGYVFRAEEQIVSAGLKKLLDEAEKRAQSV